MMSPNIGPLTRLRSPFISFPSSAWERRPEKPRFVDYRAAWAIEAELLAPAFPADLGNESKRWFAGLFKMELWLQSVLSRIAEGSLLQRECFAGTNLDFLLDERDQDAEAETEWLRHNEEVNNEWKVAVITDRQKSLMEDIRRDSFLAVFRATKHPDIAGYVSDDFDLIVRSRILGRTDPFFDRLWRTYDAGQIP